MLTLWGLLQVCFTFTSRGKLVFKSIRMFCKKLLDPCQSLLMLFTLKVSGRALGFLAGQGNATSVKFLGLCLYFLTKHSFLMHLGPSLSLPLLVPVNIS